MKTFFIFLTAVFLSVVPALAVEMMEYGTKLDVVWNDNPEAYGEPLEVQQNPVWSPDGKTIAFNGNGGGEIYTIPAGGGAPTKIYDNWGKKKGFPPAPNGTLVGGNMITLGFTPDGKEIYFLDDIIDPARGSSYTPYIGESGIESFSAVYHPVFIVQSVDIATGAVRTLVEEAQDATMSPDGRYLAYNWVSYTNYPTTGKAETGLMILDTKIGESRMLDTNGYGPGFSPDSKYVFYSDTTVNSADIMQSTISLRKISVTGGTPETITSMKISQPIPGIFKPRVSPDGKWILFFYRTSPSHTKVYKHLCVLNMDTKETYELFPNSYDIFLSVETAQWSPDGKKIAHQPKIFSDDSARGSTNYGNIYILDFPPPRGLSKMQPTAVSEAAPAGFALTGNYPNPFNPTTTIAFTLPSTGPANLAVYSITGQKIRDLVSGPMSAGAHSIVWDGRDASGLPVSSGVYLTRLSQGSHTTASRMLLAK